jgi:hypothetical protein
MFFNLGQARLCKNTLAVFGQPFSGNVVVWHSRQARERRTQNGIYVVILSISACSSAANEAAATIRLTLARTICFIRIRSSISASMSSSLAATASTEISNSMRALMHPQDPPTLPIVPREYFCDSMVFSVKRI